MEIILVFPAASKPSMRIRISFVPKIFPIILDTEPPILGALKLELDVEKEAGGDDAAIP